MSKSTTPFARYNQQRRAAKARGIAWSITFDEWMSMWIESGKWEKRGTGAGKYVMARRGDVGPYSVGNCFICSFEQNVLDGRKNTPRVRKAKQAPFVATARGWTFRSGKGFQAKPYQVTVGHKYVGCFSTQGEAEAAVKEARKALESHAFSFAPASLSTPLNEVAEA